MRITSSGKLPLSVLLALGAVKTGIDYKKAAPEDEKDVVIRNSVVVGSSIVGLAAGRRCSDAIFRFKPFEKALNSTSEWVLTLPKPKIVKNFFESLLDANRNHKFDAGEETQCTEIIRNCFKDCVMMISAIGTGILGGEILNLTYFRGREKKHKNLSMDNFIKKTTPKKDDNDAPETIKKLLGGDFKAITELEQPMAVFDALKINEEKDSVKKMKLTMYGLIANALLPTFFISIGMSLTKNLEIVKRAGIVGASGILGLLMGHRMAVQFNRTVTPKIVENVDEIKEDLAANFR